MFGGERDARQAADERRWFAHEMRATSYRSPDTTQLRSASCRIVVGIGEDSSGQPCDRTSRALAQALGTEPAAFPGGHTGFVDSPKVFASRLRTVLQCS